MTVLSPLIAIAEVRRPRARRFSAMQKHDIYRAADGRCERCSALLLCIGWDAHHKIRYRDGGNTEVANAAALCESCHAIVHRGKGRKASTSREVDANRVRQLLSYEPVTGIFRWRAPTGAWGRIPAGTVAGSLSSSHGYRQIYIDGKVYLAHRLAWLYMTGAWPSAEIDHRNMDRTDARWCNLRSSSHSENGANKRIPTNNASGYKGVSWDASRKKWFACVRVNRKTIALGRYSTAEEAHIAYCVGSRKYFGEFARLS